MDDREQFTARLMSNLDGEKDRQIAELVKALRLARARIEYLGAACTDHRHFQANVDTFLPALDEVLASVGTPTQPDHSTPRKA